MRAVKSAMRNSRGSVGGYLYTVCAIAAIGLLGSKALEISLSI
jgi:hypothetical protein